MKLATQLTLLLMAALLTDEARAQRGGIVFPQVNTPAPYWPGATTLRYNYNTPDQYFTWDQTPAVAGQGYLLPNHFLLCLRLPADPPCSHATATFNLLPGALSSTLLRSGANMAPIGYRYSYRPTVPDRLLDTPIQWNVGACTGNLDASCKFSPVTGVIVATRDVLVEKNGWDTQGFKAYLANRGSRDLLQHRVRFEIWDALFDPMSESCLTDPTRTVAADRAHMYAIKKNGDVVRFADLMPPLSGVDVVGIYQANSTYQWREAFMTVNPLPPMATGTRAHTLENSPLPIGNRPFATIVKAWADWDNVMLEPDERNTAASCAVIF